MPMLAAFNTVGSVVATSRHDNFQDANSDVNDNMNVELYV